MTKNITFLEYKDEWTFCKNNSKTPRAVCGMIKNRYLVFVSGLRAPKTLVIYRLLYGTERTPGAGARQLQDGGRSPEKPTTAAPHLLGRERGWRRSSGTTWSHQPLWPNETSEKPLRTRARASFWPGEDSPVPRGPDPLPPHGQASWCHSVSSAADRSFLSFIINYSRKDWVLLVLCVLPEDSWTWRGSMVVPNWLTSSSGC